MISKKDLRKQITEKRKTLDTKGLSKVICKNIKSSEIYKNAKDIFAYYPLPYEADITELFEDETKKWYLPKVNGETLDFFEYKKGDNLVKGSFKVLEPNGSKKYEGIPDLIIVPALCVDEDNYRLGYGKGFYDRLLEKYPDVKTLAPMFSELRVDFLPKEKHDKKVGRVISEINHRY